jgi:hypothetical protein
MGVQSESALCPRDDLNNFDQSDERPSYQLLKLQENDDFVRDETVEVKVYWAKLRQALSLSAKISLW